MKNTKEKKITLKQELMKVYQKRTLDLIERFLNAKKRSLEEDQFKSFKKYEGSDNYQKIDWKRFAKSQELYTRKNSCFKEQELILIFDTSGSIFRKREKALEIICLLFDFFSRQKKELRLFLICGTSLVEQVLELKPKKFLQEQILEIFKNLDFSGESNLYQLLKSTGQIIKKRGFEQASLVLISDLIGDLKSERQEDWLKLLNSGCFKTNRLLILKLFKKLDYQIPNLGKIKIKDPETNQSITLDSADQRVRKAYQQSAINQKSETFRELKKHPNIKVCEINSDLPLSESFDFVDF